MCCNQEMQIWSRGSCHIHENAGAVGVATCRQMSKNIWMDGGLIGADWGSPASGQGPV